MTRKVVPAWALPPTCGAANPNLGLLQGVPCPPYPPEPSKRAFIGSTFWRHAIVDAAASTVPRCSPVPATKICVSQNNIGSTRVRGAKGRTARALIHRLAFTRRPSRCKRSDDQSHTLPAPFRIETQKHVKAGVERVPCLKRFLP